MNWDLQANVSLRKGPQEQFKKLVKKQGAESCGTKAQQAPEGWRFLLSRWDHSHLPKSTSHSYKVPSVKKDAEWGKRLI